MTELTKFAHRLIQLLKESDQTLSTAESCTGGLIAKSITDVSGCSSVFFGGCVTYTNEIKTKLLGVDPQIFNAYTEVSEACAKAMAEGVRQRLNTDLGVSTTGYAGPTGGTAENPVGTVFVAVASPTETVCHRIQASQNATREEVRELAATVALEMVADAVNKIG